MKLKDRGAVVKLAAQGRTGVRMGGGKGWMLMVIIGRV